MFEREVFIFKISLLKQPARAMPCTSTWQVMRWDVGGASGTPIESWRRYGTSVVDLEDR